MDTDRPDWFGTLGPDDDEPTRGDETSRSWFEGTTFERTSPGVVEPGDPSGEQRTVVGVDAEPTAERRPDPEDAETGGRATSTSKPGASADGDATTGPDVQAPSAGDRSGAETAGGDNDDTESTTGGSLIARLKSLLGI